MGYDEKDIKDFQIGKFFRKYSSLIDIPMVKSDIDAYKKKLNAVSELGKFIDFNKNVLIVYNGDIARELFLAGFSRLEAYKTYAFLNAYDLTNAYFHTTPIDKREDSDDDSQGSHLDYTQEVLCLTLRYYEVTNKLTEEIAVSTLMSRLMGRRFRLNWVFCKGTEGDLLKQYKGVRELYDRPGCLYYDLNRRGSLGYVPVKSSPDSLYSGSLGSMSNGLENMY
jgi:hypothetical protein